MLNKIITDVLNTSLFEWIAFITSLIYVWFAARQNNLCWWFAGISSGIYVYLCSVAQLYADAALQVFYVVMAVVGWYQWQHGGQAERPVIQIKFNLHLFWIAISTLSGLACGYFLFQYTGKSGAWADGFIFTFSLSATYLLSRKVLENWIYFIVIDLVAIPLFWSRSLRLTALLYLLYTTFAVIGYRKWTEQSKTANA